MVLLLFVMRSFWLAHYQFWFEYVSESNGLCLCVSKRHRQRESDILFLLCAQMERFNSKKNIAKWSLMRSMAKISIFHSRIIQREIEIVKNVFRSFVILFAILIFISHKSYSWYFYFNSKNWHLNCPEPVNDATCAR